jgi:hypothetical protein
MPTLDVPVVLACARCLATGLGQALANAWCTQPATKIIERP